VVVVGGTDVVVLVGGTADVVVVVGGRVVGGTVVVVAPDPGPPGVAGGGKVHMPVTQSAGCAATATSTPGRASIDQTPMGAPDCRQASAGEVVCSPLSVPRYSALP
jgi:hypothetical protein